MTDKTDIEALREAALKATAGEWCTDSQHSVIADAGMNANYYVAACSGPDSQINASFIALANPTAIIALLDQLEAERQRADELESSNDRIRQRWVDEVSNNCDAGKRVSELEAELAALRGAQEPVDFIEFVNLRNPAIKKIAGWDVFENGRYVDPVTQWWFELFTNPAKPVVVLSFDQWCESRGEKPLGWVRDAMKEAYSGALEAAGIVVKDGE